MIELSANDVIKLAQMARDDVRSPILNDDDLTSVRYAAATRIGSTPARMELDRLVDDGYLIVVKKRAPHGGAPFKTYCLKDSPEVRGSKAIDAIEKILDDVHREDPDWLHDNDVTSDRYAEQNGCHWSTAMLVLNDLSDSGYFTKIRVKVKHKPGGITAYRPTDKLLALQKRQAKPKRRKK